MNFGFIHLHIDGSNITNKCENEAGAKDGESEILTCIAEGNPAPIITWYTPSNILVTSGDSKYTIMSVASSGDNVFGFEVTGTLTIHVVDSYTDYGQYTCKAFNGIANEDILKISLSGVGRATQLLRSLSPYTKRWKEMFEKQRLSLPQP